MDRAAISGGITPNAVLGRDGVIAGCSRRERCGAGAAGRVQGIASRPRGRPREDTSYTVRIAGEPMSVINTDVAVTCGVGQLNR